MKIVYSIFRKTCSKEIMLFFYRRCRSHQYFSSSFTASEKWLLRSRYLPTWKKTVNFFKNWHFKFFCDPYYLFTQCIGAYTLDARYIVLSFESWTSVAKYFYSLKCPRTNRPMTVYKFRSISENFGHP